MQTTRVQPSCSGRCQPLSSKKAVGSTAGLQARPAARKQYGSLQVVAAISRSKKEAIVADLKERLSSSTLVYGMKYSGISVKNLESMRRKLPEGASMMVTKNRLLRVAVEQLQEEDGDKWAGLKGLKGENCFVFADEDAIRGSVTAFGDFSKAMKDAQGPPPKGAAAPPPPTFVTALVLDGTVMAPDQFKSLEKMPNKLELLTKIAYGIKANPTKIALSLKAIPRKLAYGVKALSELNDDTSMTVEAAAAAKKAE